MKGFDVCTDRVIRDRKIKIIQHTNGKYSILLKAGWKIPLEVGKEWRQIRRIIRNLEQDITNKRTHGTEPKYKFKKW